MHLVAVMSAARERGEIVIATLRRIIGSCFCQASISQIKGKGYGGAESPHVCAARAPELPELICHANVDPRSGVLASPFTRLSGMF